MIIKDANLMRLVFAMQMTYAALLRYKRVMELVAQRVAEARRVARVGPRENHHNSSSLPTDDVIAVDQTAVADNEDDNDSDVLVRSDEDWVLFQAAAAAKLSETLPRREEFWHRVTQQLHPMLTAAASSAPSSNAVVGQKAQFVYQRMLLLMQLYTEVLGLRVPWTSAMPSFRVQVTPGSSIHECLAAGGRSSARDGGNHDHHQHYGDATPTTTTTCGFVDAWEAKTISALCFLLWTNLASGVKLVKLHHITLGEAKEEHSNSSRATAKSAAHRGSAGASSLEIPPLLALLKWYFAHRRASQEEFVEARSWIVTLVLWLVHSVSVKFLATAAEVHLWLSYLDNETSPTFLHVLNAMLQQSTSKAADRIADELVRSEHGSLVTAAKSFVARQREKMTTRVGSKAGDWWQMDIREHLDTAEQVVAKVEKMWAKRDDVLQSKVTSRLPSEEQPPHASGGVNDGGEDASSLSAVTRSNFVETAMRRVVAVSPVQAVLTLLHHKALPVAPSDRDDQWVTVFDGLAKEGDDDAGGLWRRIVTDVPGLFSSSYATWQCCWTLLYSRPASRHHQDELAINILKSVCTLHNTSDEETRRAHRSTTPRSSFSSIFWGSKGGATSQHRTTPCDETHKIGLALLLLVARHRCCAAESDSVQWTAENDAELERLLAAIYGGTLSVVDRIVYAGMLLVSMCRQQQREEEVEPSPDLWCPEALHRARFLIGEEETATALDGEATDENEGSGLTTSYSGWIPEVAAAVRLLEMVTRREMAEMALEIPGTLHNRAALPLRCDSQPTAAVEASTSILALIFPDAVSATQSVDVAVAVMDVRRAACSESLRDPRYLLPLAHCVGAIHRHDASLVPTHVLTHMFHLCVRGLSFVGRTLRRIAAAALGLMFKSLAVHERLITNYARIYISSSKDSSRATPKNPRSTGVARLPAAVSAFLILCEPALVDYAHPLHRDAMRWFGENPQPGTEIPLQHLLSSFPPACVAVEALHEAHDREKRSSSSAVAFEEQVPPHLRFIFRVLKHCNVGTEDDARRLVHSGALLAAMTLIGMQAASRRLREYMLRCLCAACDVRATRILATETGLPTWLLLFVSQCCDEASLDEPVMCSALHLFAQLMRRGCGAAAGPGVVAQWAQTLDDLGCRRFVERRVSAKVLRSALADAVSSLDTSAVTD